VPADSGRRDVCIVMYTNLLLVEYSSKLWLPDMIASTIEARDVLPQKGGFQVYLSGGIELIVGGSMRYYRPRSTRPERWSCEKKYISAVT
jgi:hypothetical protein